MKRTILFGFAILVIACTSQPPDYITLARPLAIKLNIPSVYSPATVTLKEALTRFNEGRFEEARQGIDKYLETHSEAEYGAYARFSLATTLYFEGYNLLSVEKELPPQIDEAVNYFQQSELYRHIGKDERAYATLLLAKGYFLKAKPDSAQIYLERISLGESKYAETARELLDKMD